ncbi:MAG: ABC transporter substrate-binding protein [Alphaproteobacteria bacterium GM202ARS2]|nr:ABC transporter substrate-binding protein [Alphaproteobacteria bacterium GM202ARS2]
MLHRGIVFALLVFLMPSFVSAAGSEQGAQTFIEEFSKKSLNSFRGKDNVKDIERIFSGIYDKNFDNDSIARFVLSRNWRKASADEQKEFTNLFRKYIVRVYSARFHSYSGDVRVTTTRSEGAGIYIVSSSFVPKEGENNGKPVVVDWRVGYSDLGYRIYDITVGGVSLAVTQRSEIASIVRNGGGKISSMIDVLRKKVGS